MFSYEYIFVIWNAFFSYIYILTVAFSVLCFCVLCSNEVLTSMIYKHNHQSPCTIVIDISSESAGITNLRNS